MWRLFIEVENHTYFAQYSVQYLKLRRLFRRILRDDLVARQKGLLALTCSFESLLVATAREENRLCVIYFSMFDRKANGAWMFRS